MRLNNCGRLAQKFLQMFPIPWEASWCQYIPPTMHDFVDKAQGSGIAGRGPGAPCLLALATAPAPTLDPTSDPDRPCERLRAVASLAEDPEFHISRVLEPGDLEIIHNPTIFHARSDIHDGEARGRT